MGVAISALEAPNTAGKFKEVDCTVTFDSSYPTGGESITAADVGLGQIVDLLPLSSTSGYAFSWDKTNAKLQAFRTDQVDDPEEEVPDTTDLSAASVRVRVRGHG